MIRATISALLGLTTTIYFIVLDRGILRIAANDSGTYNQLILGFFTSAVIIAAALGLAFGFNVLLDRNNMGSSRRIAFMGIVLSVIAIFSSYLLPLFSIAQ